MKKKFKRKRGPVRSKKVTFDGITFASGLERYMYQALKKAKIKSNQKIPDDLSLYNGIKTLRFALKLNDFKIYNCST